MQTLRSYMCKKPVSGIISFLPSCSCVMCSCVLSCGLFLQVTELLFDHVWSSWGQLLNDILAGLPSALAAPNTPAPPGLLMAFERWLLLLKVLSILPSGLSFAALRL